MKALTQYINKHKIGRTDGSSSVWVESQQAKARQAPHDILHGRFFMVGRIGEQQCSPYSLARSFNLVSPGHQIESWGSGLIKAKEPHHVHHPIRKNLACVIDEKRRAYVFTAPLQSSATSKHNARGNNTRKRYAGLPCAGVFTPHHRQIESAKNRIGHSYYGGGFTASAGGEAA